MDSGGLIWIPVTLGATAAQVMRTARQHELRGHLSSFGAAYVRFLFAWPLALVSLALTRVLSPQSLSVPGRFYLWIGAAAVVQITGTALLLQAFRARDFAIGTVYSKSEVILVAIGSAIFLNEPLRSTGWVGAVAVLMGVALLAATSGISAALRGLGDRAAWFGVAAGFFSVFSNRYPRRFDLFNRSIRVASNLFYFVCATYLPNVDSWLVAFGLRPKATHRNLAPPAHMLSSWFLKFLRNYRVDSSDDPCKRHQSSNAWAIRNSARICSLAYPPKGTSSLPRLPGSALVLAGILLVVAFG